MSIRQETNTLTGTVTNEVSLWQTLSSLFKLRIVSLLLFAAVGGAFLGAAGRPGLLDMIILLMTGGLSAAGASALNQYIERDSDGDMKRTRQRPLVTGHIQHPEYVLWIALAMILLPVAAVWPFNPELGFFLLLGAMIYVGVYTIWLKPRTMLNIVIGGAAGSCAVLSGGAAVGAWNDPGVLALAAIVFLWTPTHFWALAIMYREDYIASKTPMLPARTSARTSAIWGFVHAIGLAILAIAIGAHAALGLIYFVPSLLMTLYFLYHSVRLIFVPTRKQALKLFLTSNLYLAVIIMFVCISSVAGY